MTCKTKTYRRAERDKTDVSIFRQLPDRLLEVDPHLMQILLRHASIDNKHEDGWSYGVRSYCE